MKLKTLAVILVVFGLLGFQAFGGMMNKDTKVLADKFLKSVPENMMYLMPVKSLINAVKQGENNVVILDIRPPVHYNNGHIKGALHIPMPMIVEKMEMIPKDKKIAVVCAMDTNSAFVVSVLRMFGYNAWVVDGGVPGWVKMGMPLEK